MVAVMTVVDDEPPGAELRRLRPVLETALDAVVVMDAGGWVIDWNWRAEQTFGWTREQAVGRLMAELIVPDGLREAHRQGLARYVATREARVLGERLEVSALTRDGREIPVELSINRWADGDQILFVGFLRDVSASRRAAEDLRQSQARLLATQQHASVGIAEVDGTGRYLRVNPALCSITGYSEADLLSGMTFLDVTHPGDREAELDRYRRHVAGELDNYASENRYVRKDQRIITVSVSAAAVRDHAGQFLYGVRVVQDVTERRMAEARQRLLMDELNHRVKNILALVIAIATQTGRTATSTAEFNRDFAERLKSLAKSHELLIRERWEGAALSDVVVGALRAYGARLTVEGPPVRLSPRAAVSLSLILHELGTNAAKYGAWSAPGGTVGLSWTPAGEAHLELTWTERGGPAPSPGPAGFGSRLVTRLARDDFDGTAAFRFAPEGVEILLSLRSFAPEASAAPPEDGPA